MTLKLTKTHHAVLILVLTGIVFGLSIKLADSRASSASACANLGQDRTIVMSGDTFSPATTTANQCDRIVLLNQDTLDYRPAMGIHSSHVQYPGFFVTTVPAGEGVSFVATQAGQYKLHDHLRDVAHADLTINPKK